MSERSISATPPPWAVEFTFQKVRSRSSSRPRAIVCSNSVRRSGERTARKRSGSSGVTATSSRGTARAYRWRHPRRARTPQVTSDQRGALGAERRLRGLEDLLGELDQAGGVAPLVV